MNVLARQALILPISFCLLLNCSTDPRRQRQKFLDRGIASLKKGKTNEAALDFMNALKADPKSFETANLLAEIEFRRHNYSRAYALVQQALAAKPDYLPAHRGLARIYQLGGKLPEAQKEYATILQHNPDDIDALINTGLIQVRQRQFGDAEGSFNRVLEIQPNHPGALLSLASASEQMNKPDAAEHYLKLAVGTNPRSVQAQLALIDFYIRAGRYAEAEPLFARALAMTGNDVRILDAQAGFYEGLNRSADAKAVIARIQNSHPQDSRYWRSLAEFYVRANDWPNAEAELKRVLQTHKDDPQTVHELIELYLSVGNRNAAQNLDEALLGKSPEDIYGRLFKGRLLLMAGRVDKALLEFYQVQKYEPNLPALHYWLAQAHIQSKEFKQARQELATALLYDPGYEDARLSLANLENAAGMFDQAALNARRVAEKRPQNTKAMLAYAEALTGRKDYASAAGVVDAVLKRNPTDPLAHRLSGLIHLARKDLPAARKEFQQAWKGDPHSQELLEAVVLGYFAASQRSEAIAFLKNEIVSHPGDLILSRELGQVYLWQEDASNAVAALRTALRTVPGDPDASILLAGALLAENQPADAANVVQDAMKRHPEDFTLALRAGMVFEKLQDWNDARDAYAKALQLDSDNVVAKNNLAWILSEHNGNIDLALELAQQAQEASGNTPEIMDTIGWIYYKKGVYKMAQRYLTDCVNRDQRNATFQYQLGMVELKLGDRDSARHRLRTALTLDPHLPTAEAARAALAEL